MMSAFCLLKSARMWRCWLSIILIGLTLLPRPTLCGKREGLYSKHYRQGDRLIVKYAIDGTAGGLVNQLLCHIGAFMFAVPLNAEIALPSALSRSTYNNSWWQQEWKYRPLRTLLDVDDLVRYWKRRGILVHEAGQMIPRADAMGRELVLPPYHTIDTENDTIKFHFTGQNRDLATVLAEAKEVLTRLVHNNKTRQISVLDLGVINSEHFPYNIQRYKQLSTEVVGSLTFAPQIRELVQNIVRQVSNNGQRPFGGLHLRFERDGLSAWATNNDAKEELWKGYIAGMKRAGFNANQNVYIASGLLTYNDHTEFDSRAADLRKYQLCKNVLHKEMYLTSQTLEGLHSEQKALIDLLVLAEADTFVGTMRSSFSCYARDLRTFAQKKQESSVIIKVGDFPSNVLPFQELVATNPGTHGNR